MYAALQRLGFTHGRILEPALGLGHFIGLMPEAMHARSLITGIEIDSVTARLAKALYPDADIRHQPFEESKLADGFYDVAISKHTLRRYEPYDPRFKAWKFLIHDYFFAAALDKVRPGGLILFITSKGTLDKQDGALREYVASQADLLGAIRLPNDAFKRNANTEVTTDIVILRKRLPGEPPAGPAWKEVDRDHQLPGREHRRQRVLRRPPRDDAGRDAARRPDVWAGRTHPGRQRPRPGRSVGRSDCAAAAGRVPPGGAPGGPADVGAVLPRPGAHQAQRVRAPE